MAYTPAAEGFDKSSANVDTLAAQQQARARASSSNPWATQGTNPDGTIAQSFTGPMAGANQSMMGEALRNMGQPMDFSQFNVGAGDDYRNQAIGNAQGQMDPWFGGMQSGQDDATKQRLLSQGFAEGSPEFQKGMGADAGWGQDMRQTMGNLAIGLGAQGGQMLQGQAMQTNQQGLSEALRTRGYPMEALGKMQGLTDGSGPREADDSEFQGAVMDSDRKYKDYWGARGRVVEEDNAFLDAVFGVGGAAMSLVPVAGGLLSGGTQAIKNGGKGKRTK